MIEIFWTRPAEEDLRSLFEYLTEVQGFSGDDALIVIGRLMDKPEMLTNGLTDIGQKEPLLEHLPQSYRYLLLDGKYKLIYSVVDSRVYIHMVFDTRQNPRNLQERFETD